MEPGWKPVQPQDLPHVLQRPKTGGDPCLVIDARDASAYVEAHIDGAINVPVPTFTPRSGAEFGHMYSLTQLESDLEPKAARKFLGRKGRRVLIYDDGAQGTESGELFSSSTKSRVTTKPTFSFAPANTPNMLRMHPHLQHAFHAYSPHLHSHRPHAAHAAPAGRWV
jgi:rhodanese-related sulfurtransferase